MNEEQQVEAVRDVVKSEGFGIRLRQRFFLNEAYRRPKELEWLENLRQYKGIYDPDVKIDDQNSHVYPKLTRSKCNMVLSRLHEMLFPDTDRSWNIEATPEPRVDPKIVKTIAMSLIQKDPQSGQMIPPTVEQLNLAVREYVKMSCSRMQSVIDDQLGEMLYTEETKKVLRSGLWFGTGVMKGPLVNLRRKRTWIPDPESNGDYIESQEKFDIPYYQNVRLWDWYPDMGVTDPNAMDGCFERHVMTKHEVRGLMLRADFDAEVIRQYLRDHPDGDYVAKNWEIDLQTIELQAGSHTAVTSSMVAGSDPAGTNRPVGRKYELLEYWGYVDGADLAACGVNVEDEDLEYEANVWTIGNQPCKVMLRKNARDWYKVFYYEKDETSLFGEGLPRIMRHSAIAIGAASRMCLDNAAVVAGPQVEVNWDLMTMQTDTSSFYPRKIWYRTGRGVEAQYPAIRGLEFNSHIPELINIINLFKQFADEETTLPTWMISENRPANETAQAVSMRMGSINISVKDVVRNFDSFTESTISGLYAWNMEFNPRIDIKGDYNVRPQGTSSLVMKEIRMQAMNQLAATMTPEDWAYVPRRQFLEERFKSYDIKIDLYSDAEVNEKQKMNMYMMELAVREKEAMIEYRKSQSMNQLTKAKDKNIEANQRMAAGPETTTQTDPRLTDAEVQQKNAEVEQVRTKTGIALADATSKMQDRERKGQIDAAVKASTAAAKMENEREVSAAKAEGIREKAKQKPAAKERAK